MTARSRLLMIVLALGGLAASGASSWVHHRLLTQPGYVSPCDVNATVSCTQAYLSPYGSLFGVPVAILGAIWFAVVLALVVAAPRGTPAFRENVGAYVFALSTVGLAVVLYLAYASFFILKALCLLCVATYVAVVGLFIVSGASSTVPMRRLPSRMKRDISALASSPLAIAIALVLLAGAGSLVMFFPREGQPAAAAATVAQGSQQAGQAEPDFEALWKAAPREDIGVPADGAKVVIVKFNDYQCPGCAQAHRMYNDLIRTMQAKHPGQIVSLTMDYPLERECNANVGRDIHPAACDAAAAVRMARPLGKAEEVEEWLYNNQAAMTPATVRAAVRRIAGVTDFDARYPAVLRDVQLDVARGGANRVMSTPTYFINGVRVAGQLIPAEWFQKAIELELAKN
ncbi:MAG TPA: vitamin K epoxide reductase family protein [Vicinamibacterales bacterium]|nr:vitamin K epoxide reductase family protein [Vicinamibacterales bacterium]